MLLLLAVLWGCLAVTHFAHAQPTPSMRVQMSNIERLIDNGVLTEAARQLELYLNQFPHDRNARRLLVTVYRSLEEHYKVFEQAQILLNDRPNDQEVLAWAAEARRAIEALYPELIQRYRSILERNPQGHVTPQGDGGDHGAARRY
ncbi:MAG: hypothetical protein LR015_04040 [Verrucomicrobia bacterium]|nr:hypothetical protein [Verrucomicrobiota bacterium]